MTRRYRITIDIERIDTKGLNGAKVGSEREDELTEQETEVIALLTQGMSNKAIARVLSITEATVKVHFKHIFRKIGVENRTQAAFWAVKQRLVSHDLEEDR